jgi:hypothetical protein
LAGFDLGSDAGGAVAVVVGDEDVQAGIVGSARRHTTGAPGGGVACATRGLHAASYDAPRHTNTLGDKP